MNSIRTSLRHAPGEATSEAELKAMARAAWKRGVAVIWLRDVKSDFNKQVIINECEAQYGKR